LYELFGAGVEKYLILIQGAALVVALIAIRDVPRNLICFQNLIWVQIWILNSH
jgi:hypothetical protein